MARCISPLRIRNPDPHKIAGEFIDVPCGKCANCLSNKREEWSYRCRNELETCNFALFMTYTYDDDHLPCIAYDTTSGELLSFRLSETPTTHKVDYVSHVLCKDDIVKYFKRLRKDLSKRNITLRLVYVGEYGSHTYRPHYHALLYFYGNENLIDRQFVEDCVAYNWHFGNVKFGKVTSMSIRYTLKDMVKQTIKNDNYLLEKITRGLSDYFPFRYVSRRPGIGSLWYNKHKTFYDSQTFSGLPINEARHIIAVPRYYKDKSFAQYYDKNDDGTKTLSVLGKVIKNRLNVINQNRNEKRDLEKGAAFGLGYSDYWRIKVDEMLQTEQQKRIKQQEKTGKF